MGDGNSLVKMDGEPAKILIEKIADAIGWIAAPHQLKRMAKAEVEAQKIKALGQIEITEIQERSLVRMIHVETRKQENIEQIAAKAIDGLNENAQPNDIDKDWIANFFDKCENVSDQDMQSLWARILAGEANNPGSFSKRTINIVSSLDRNEAHQFTTLCRFCWIIVSLTPLIFDINSEIYKDQGLTFGLLTHLDSIGLITFNSLGTYERRGLPQKFGVSYYGKIQQIELPEKANGKMTLGSVLLTKIGQELAPICGATPIDGVIEYVSENWEKNGSII